MIAIEYPGIKPALKTEQGKEYIFCVIRKKWLIITPEEWVRQNVLLYMLHRMYYPASLIAVEKQLQVGELKKRFDIVLYKDATPFLLIECKAMQVPVSQKTMEQAMRYNIALRAGHFIITNGNNSYGFSMVNGTIKTLNKFPAWNENHKKIINA